MSRPANAFLPLFNLLGVLGAAFSYPALQRVTQCPGMNGYLVQAAAEMAGSLRGRAWGGGVKGRDCVLRLKPGLQIKPSCPSFAAAEAQQGWKRKPECLCHFSPAQGAGKYFVKRVHSGGVTLVQQEASLLCPDLHCPSGRFDVQLHL